MTIRIIIFLMLCSGGLAFADEPPPIAIATDHFQESLVNLKQSVERLTQSNAVLAGQNAQLKDALVKLRLQLGQMQQENGLLTKAADKLHEQSPAHGKQIAQLQKDIFELQNQQDKLEAQLRMANAAVEEKRKEEDQLTQQINQAQTPQPIAPPVLTPEQMAAKQAQKEKLKLIKMILDSKQKQSVLQEAIAAAQADANTSAYAKALAHKQFLTNEISKIHEQMKQTSQNPTPVGDIKSLEEMQQLEAQINALQKNHDELEDLVEKMQKKAQSIGIKQDARKEKDKLDQNLAKLKTEYLSLKSQLETLRSQMVELDKRKGKLQSMLP